MLIFKLFGRASRERRLASIARGNRRRMGVEKLEQRLALTGTTFDVQSVSPGSWSVAGGGELTISLAAAAFTGAGNQLVQFGAGGPQVQATYVSGTQITVVSPGLAVLSGWSNADLPIDLTITDTQAPGPQTTTGSNTFTVEPVLIQSVSPSSAFLSAQPVVTITASSAANGFGTEAGFASLGVVVDFFDGANHHYGSNVTWVSATEIHVDAPKVATAGAYTVNVSMASKASSKPAAPGTDSFTFLADPTFSTMEIHTDDNTGPLPSGAEIYLLLSGNSQYYTINNDGTITPAGSSATPTALSSITNVVDGRTVITSTVTLDSARLYFMTSSTQATQPSPSGSAFYYDYIEPNFQTTSLNVDTSQVDQFGMPITIQVVPNDPAHTAGSGISDGINRKQIFDHYQSQMVGPFAAFQDSLEDVGGDPLYRILAPQYVIDRQFTAVQQLASTTATILPALDGAPGAWLASIMVPASLGGQVQPGAFVSGPHVPAGTYVQSVSTDKTQLTVVNTAGTTSPFMPATITPSVSGTGLNIINVPPGGFTGLASWFGPTWQSTKNVNSGNPIDDFFAFYTTNSFWQEDNGTTNVVLYEGKVTQISAPDINGGTSTYAVLQFKDSASPATDPGTYNIFYPYFTTNSPVGKTDPFGNPVPPPPAYFTLGNSAQAITNYVPPSQMVFGASGVFADQKAQSTGVAAITVTDEGDGYTTAPAVTFSASPAGAAYTATGTATLEGGKVVGIEITNPGFGYVDAPTVTIAAPASTGAQAHATANLATGVFETVLADLERDIAAAFIRGYGTTIISTSNPVDSADLPTFAAKDATSGVWTLTSPADVALAGSIKQGMYLSSFKALNFPMLIDSVTTVDGKVEITALAVNGLVAYAPDNLQFFNLYEAGSVYDAYSAFFQNKGDFTTGIDGKPVNIAGRAYGDPYSDYMDFSSDIQANPSVTGPSTQTATLYVTLDPWGSTVGSSIAFVSGDFDGNGLDDVAELTSVGQWEVALTPSSGDPTTENVGSPWTTSGIEWKDFTAIHAGDRDVIIARAEGAGVGSWWKLSFDGSVWNTDFVGSWEISAEWLDYVSGDFDGDLTTDIAARTHDNGEWWMLANAAEAVTPATYAAKNVKIGEWHPHVQWEAVVAGDLNGGGVRDSIAGLSGTTWWQLDYLGSGNFTNSAITTNWSDTTTWKDFVVGNFTGAANGQQGIAARNASNAWYTVSNTGNPGQQPTLMATWAAGIWSNVIVGNFSGDASSAVGIAGRQNSTGDWYVVQKQGSAYESVNFGGAWPTSSVWAQAFAGIYATQAESPKKAGILGRSFSGTSTTWYKALSNGTGFTSSPAPGYPS